MVLRAVTEKRYVGSRDQYRSNQKETTSEMQKTDSIRFLKATSKILTLNCYLKVNGLTICKAFPTLNYDHFER